MSETPKFQRTRAVALTVLKLGVGKTAYIKVTDAIHEGSAIKAKAGDDAKDQKKPARVATVINLETGESHTFIFGSVLESQLNEIYPDNGYIDKCFEVTKLGKREGKAYNDYAVYEIADPSETKPDTGKAKK